MQNPLTTYLESQFVTYPTNSNLSYINFYDNFKTIPIEFKFREEGLPIEKKLYWCDFYLHAIILRLLNFHREGIVNNEDEELFSNELKTFCYSFWVMYQLLIIYINYKKHKSHVVAVTELMSLNVNTGIAGYDIFVLSLNFFLRRILDKDKKTHEDMLADIQSRIHAYKGINIGKL
jgi:hypothetical protein